MALRIRIAKQKPESLAEAVSEFENILTEDQKAVFKSYCGSPTPNSTDVIGLAIEIKHNVARSRQAKKFLDKEVLGISLINTLELAQKFSTAIDVLVGGSQSQIASAIWGVIKISLQIASTFTSYFERLAALFTEVSRRCPRIKEFGELYPNSKELRTALDGYYITVVQICKKSLLFLRKRSASQMWASLIHPFETDFGKLREDLKEEADTVEAIVRVVSLQRDAEFQVATIKHRDRKAELRFFNACSTYNYKTAWKNALLRGKTAWVFRKDEYKQWRQEKNSSVLWCTGNLGSGKTVLSANIVEDLFCLRPTAKVAFFFCKYDESISLNVRTIIGSIARQIFESVKAEIPNFATEVDGVELGTLDSDQILDYLEKLLPATRSYHVLIDGIDECGEEDIKLLISYLQRLLESKIQFQVYCSSRQDIYRQVSAPLKPRLRQLNVTLSDLNSEIEDYIQAELERRVAITEELSLVNPVNILKIKTTLLEKAHGMFLWVYFQIEDICSQNTDAGVLRVLQDLPTGLPETFNRILRRLQHSEFANPILSKKILSLIAAAKRPLTIEELQIAISIEPGQKEWDAENFVSDMSRPLNSCGSLLLCDEDNSTVHFVHQSVKQHFFTTIIDSDFSGYHMNPLDVDISLGKISVTYLNFGISSRDLVITAAPSAPKVNNYPSDILSRTLPPGMKTKLTLRLLKMKRASSHDYRSLLEETARKVEPSKLQIPPEYHFLAYAREYWLQHSKLFGISKEDTCTWWKRLVDGGSTAVDLPWTTPDSCTEWIVQNEHWALIMRALGLLLSVTPIKTHFLSADPSQRAKIELLMEALPDTKAVTPELANDYDKVLRQALKSCNFKVAEHLLEKGAGVNRVYDRFERTSLVAAAESGSISIVQLMLKKGADVSGKTGEESLLAASKYGSTELVQLLLEAGVDVSSEKGQASIVAAAKCGSTELVKLLLKNGADASGKTGEESLVAAAKCGSTELVKLLLKNGVDASGKTGEKSLVAAAQCGSTELVKLFLKAGTDVNTQAFDHTALTAASSKPETENVVRLLLDSGANIKLTGKSGNALQVATRHAENDRTVRLLLEHGADANDLQDFYSDPIFMHSTSSEDSIRKVLRVPLIDAMEHLRNRELLLNGASSVSEDRQDEFFDEQCFPIIQEYQSSRDISEQDYGNRLHIAAFLFEADILALLLDKGADVNAQGGFYGSTLQAAAASGVEPSCKIDILLERRAQINIQGGIFGNPLQAAACMSNETVLHRLLEMGADVNAQGGAFGNALQAAAFCCDEISVRSLLKRRANINTSGGYYGNALQAATVSHKKPNEKVQLLLESGANPNLSGGYYGSALQAAAVSYKKFNKSFELLLNAGANINAQGGRFGSALQAVAATKTTKSLERLKLLLHRGANVNAEGGWYGNALQVAAYHNNKVAVELLLQNKADILAKGGRMKNVLVASIAHTLYNKDREELVGLILKKGAKAKAPKDWYDIALDGDIFKKLHRITHEKHVHEKYVQLVRDAREARRFPKSFKSSK